MSMNFINAHVTARCVLTFVRLLKGYRKGPRANSVIVIEGI